MSEKQQFSFGQGNSDTQASVFSNCSLFPADLGTEVPVLNLVGEIDLSSAQRIYSSIWQSSHNGSQSIVIDLSKLDFMDSSGLQVFLRLREKLAAKQRRVLLVCPNPQIERLFQLTGFDQLFDCYPTAGEALDALVPGA